MEKFVLRLLIITSACSLSQKHVIVNQKHIWYNAKIHCREKYTDLSPITSEVEERVFKESVGEDQSGWIGLYWDPKNRNWTWSGGDNVTYQNWVNGPPVVTSNARWASNGWHVEDGESKHKFFCLNLIVVQEEKTWEEALEHCRESHSDLTSLLSKTENLLAQTEIQPTNVTERVWIGLRFLEDNWLWVNGDPLEYKAWPREGDQDHQCPMWRRCGALTKDGVWENIDCQEKLHFFCV
ncbi:secretory phospholipase A2 receptor-like [Leuresthes tenuis]|uniref:secretory phospholipase A2 receptor-like n=1 Tax=Leuresthes tenuis TaxID=355514 RepID=UPI003B508653